MYERDLEMLGDIAQAVFAGDLAQAETALELMRNAAHAEDVRDALAAVKRRTRPLPPAPALAVPDTLPRPGHLPGSMEGSPRVARKRAA